MGEKGAVYPEVGHAVAQDGTKSGDDSRFMGLFVFEFRKGEPDAGCVGRESD